MAIDKRRTAPWLKVVIVFVAVLMVVSVLMSTFIGQTGGGSSQAANPTQPGAQETTASIAAKYQGTAQAAEAQLKADPDNYDVLVQQGNTYFDWALGVQQATAQQRTGEDMPLWLQAATYYKRALDVKPGDPKVVTDYSVALFSSGQSQQAITEIEAVIAKNPDFGQAYYNAGIYYINTGQNQKAIDAMQKYLKMDPNGSVGNPQTANSIIEQAQQGLQSGGTTGSAPATK